MLIASLPSPSDGSIDIGPLPVHAYGLMIALGVVAAVWLAGRRLEASGAGSRDDISSIALWAVLAGVVGSRLYHVVTDWEKFTDRPGEIVKIWRGGLGIPGGLLAGITVGLLVARRRGVPLGQVADASAPAIPLAQAIGRWGNWWNQELYGRPTGLPWALRIDDEHLPGGAPSVRYPHGTTFHPTFLYESLWNLALCAALILIGRRFRLRPGRLLAIYLVGYSVGRFWVEGLRIDEAKEGAGLRLNQWVALTVGLLALAFLLIDKLRHAGDEPPEPAGHPSAGGPLLAADGADPSPGHDAAGAGPAPLVAGQVASRGRIALDDDTDPVEVGELDVADIAEGPDPDGDPPGG